MKTNLKIARVDCRLTQADIAKKTGVSVQTVYQWEQGLTAVSKRHWANIAFLFGVTEDKLQEILVQTLLDGCIARHDAKPLLNAQTSRLYRADLLLSALAEFEAGGSAYPANPRAANEQPVDFERERLEYERALLERDKRIFELEKQVEELRRELESVPRPAASISSVLSIEPIKHEVNHE